jgi:hypothetical protein
MMGTIGFMNNKSIKMMKPKQVLAKDYEMLQN